MIRNFQENKQLSQSMEIQNFHEETIQQDPNYFENNWSILTEFLDSIYKYDNFNDFCFEDIYEIVYYLCLNNEQKKIHDKLVEYFNSYFQEQILKIRNNSNQDYLQQLELLWSKLKSSSQILSELFRYFECTYLYTSPTRNFQELIIQILQQISTNEQDLMKKIIQQTIKLVYQFRTEQMLDESTENLLLHTIEILIALQQYNDNFEPELLNQSEIFYTECQQNLIENFEIKSFIQNLDQKFLREQELIQKNLNQSTGNKLQKILDNKLIKENLQIIMQQGVEILIQENDDQNLKSVYQYLERVQAIEYLRKTLNSNIKENGIKLVNESDPNELVDKILKYRINLENIVTKNFKANSQINAAIDYAFEFFINLKPNNMAELISQSLDNKLKKSGKVNLDQIEVQQDLKLQLLLFKYLQAKDIFEAFYTKRFLKRLLGGGTSSVDLEKFVLDQLKENCGASYTKNCDEIFKDLETSKEYNRNFQDYLIAQKLNEQAELYVNVISSGSWPLLNKQVINLPPEFDILRTRFEKFYSTKISWQNLLWQYETSHCEVRGTIGNKTYTFLLNTLQAIILIAYNKQDSFSFTEFEQMLQLDKEDVKKTVLSLFHMKEKLLVKTGQKTIIDDTDLFTINNEYVSKLNRVKIHNITKKETKEEIEITTDKVLQERQYILDACIVRIMKAKKTLNHNDLIKEIFNDLKVPITVPEIKKRIENLINREFLRRNEDDRTEYHYVA